MQQVIALVREVEGAIRGGGHPRPRPPHLARAGPPSHRQGGDPRYQAVEIETLGERRAVQDLLALTRALHHRADQESLLAVLRAGAACCSRICTCSPP